MRWTWLVLGLIALGCSGEDTPAFTGSAPRADAGEADTVNQIVCESGQQASCSCVGGVAGAQRCRDDGSGWGTCDCPDATTDAAADAAPDVADVDAVVDVNDATMDGDAPIDAADDALDAQVEASACDAGETQSCCGGSTITCLNGAWPACPTPHETCNGQDDDCNGVVDDHLSDSYLTDENSSGIDDCAYAHTAAFLTPIYEDAPAKSFSFHLAKQDGSEDRDFFSFTTFDTTDVECASNTFECFWMNVRLAEPSGADLEMCLYEIGDVDEPVSCASYETKACSGEGGNPPNELTIPHEGGCGAYDDDGRRYVIEVFLVPGSAPTCEPYTLMLHLAANAPQMTPCGF